MDAIFRRIRDAEAPLDALAHVLDHLWEDELRDYEASEARGHLFEHLVEVANWLNGGSGRAPRHHVKDRLAGLASGWRAPATLEPPGSPLRVEVRERPLFATFELALAYCLSETVDCARGEGHAIAVRYAEIAGFEDDIHRRLDEAPRRWLVAGLARWEEGV